VAEIYHMLRAEVWEAVRLGARYDGDTLASEGFIHCTAGERNLLQVARRFAAQPGQWLVLVLDPARIAADVRWEVQPDGMAYPHIYGPLNLDAVVEVCSFPRDPEGRFLAFRNEIVH
jgi:glutathione S-transferase